MCAKWHILSTRHQNLTWVHVVSEWAPQLFSLSHTIPSIVAWVKNMQFSVLWGGKSPLQYFFQIFQKLPQTFSFFTAVFHPGLIYLSAFRTWGTACWVMFQFPTESIAMPILLASNTRYNCALVSNSCNLEISARFLDLQLYRNENRAPRPQFGHKLSFCHSNN